jgi:hypothetical protein
MKELKVISADLLEVLDKNTAVPESLNPALKKLQEHYRVYQIIDIKIFNNKVNALILVESL